MSEYIDKNTQLTQLRDRAIACAACNCYKNRSQADRIVFSDGSPDAKLMIISEAPGRNEDLQGCPFVGKAGQYLDKILAWIRLDRKRDIYLCNSLKCWPGDGNPTPTAKQVKACWPFLEAQIRIIQPKLIIALGLVSFRKLTGESQSMKYVHGKLYKYGDITVIPTYHPASYFYGDEEAVASKKQAAKEDWTIIRNTYDKLLLTS